MPLFSVIIPTYGRPRFLQEAVESVRAQSVDSLEIIIVDDASPEEVTKPDLRGIKLIRAATNGGAASARNLGVEAARGDILAFLDDDDTWSPNRLEMALQGHTRAPIAVCWQSPQGRMLDGDVYDSILDDTTPSLGAVSILGSSWVPLDVSFRSCEDLVWWLDVSRKARVATFPEQGLYVRRHPGERAGYGQEQRIRDSYRLMEERAEYFAEHPRAAAFRYRRIGIMNRSLGRRRQARTAHAQAFRLDPNLRDIAHLVRNLRSDDSPPR